MKFVVSRTELSNLIKKLQNIVPQHPSLPILSHCLVEATHDELVFTATDLSVGVRCSIKAKVQEKGSLSIPSKRFFQLVRELTEPTLEISALRSGVAEIKTSSSEFRLHGLSKDTYPELPDLREAIQFTIDTQLFKEMLYRTAFAASREESRFFALTGVLMRIEGGKAIFVGTDSKRLAKTECLVATDPDFFGEYIIPLKAVDEILKNLDEEEQVMLYLTKDKIAVESGSTLLITKLLAGEYPDFTQVIPKEQGEALTLHREELIALLRQISLFTNNMQSVRFTFDAGELILTANCAEVGEGIVNMPVNYSGAKLEIAFNPHFFLDVLRHTKDETVNLYISDSYNPGVITDSTDTLFVIMPMRLNSDRDA